MAQFPALPLFTDALLADTAHLDNAEFGLYMRLLILIWRTPGCSVPNDPVWLSRRLKADPAMLAGIIDEFCKVENGGQRLTQKRLKKEFQYLSDQSKKQRERAVKRWGSDKASSGHAAQEKKPESFLTDFDSPADKPLKGKKKDICRSDATSGNAPHPTPPPLDNPNGLSYPLPPKSVLPDWLPKDLWDDFLKMRQKIRKPATDRAQKLIIKKTETLANATPDRIAILEQSIRNGWQDVYAIKDSGNITGKRAGYNPNDALTLALDDPFAI